MKISAVIPTIGREGYLPLAIHSLVEQSEPFDEIVIFDNSVKQNITLNTELRELENIKVIRSGKQLPPIQSWNSAVASCENDYVVILGDDDIALKNFKKEVQRALINSDVVIAKADNIDENGLFIQDLPYPNQCELSDNKFFQERIKGSCSLFVPGIAFNKKLFLDIGGFQNTGIEGCAYSDELLLITMSVKNKKISITKSICWRYRVHSGQIAGVRKISDVLITSQNYIRIFENSLTNINGMNENFNNKIRIEYLVRVIEYRILLYVEYSASNKMNFYDFQTELFKNLYSNKIINTKHSILLHLKATKFFVSLMLRSSK